MEKRFDIEIRTIYACSARNALMYYTKKTTDPNYADAFENMLAQMTADIRSNKQQIIFNKMMIMINSLSEELKTSQKQIKETSEREMELLKQYSLDKLDLEYQRMLKDYLSALAQEEAVFRKNIANRLNTINNSWLINIRREINRQTGVFELKNFAENTLPTRVEGYERIIRDRLNQDSIGLREKYDAFAGNVAEYMKKYSMNVGIISADKHRLEKITLPVIPNNNNIIWEFGYFGLLMGLINVVSFARNLVKVYIFGEKALQKQKDKLFQQIENGVKTAYPDIKQKWTDSYSQLVKQFSSDGTKLMHRYKERYSELFSEKRAEFDQNRKELEASIVLSDTYLSALELIENRAKSI